MANCSSSPMEKERQQALLIDTSLSLGLFVAFSKEGEVSDTFTVRLGFSTLIRGFSTWAHAQSRYCTTFMKRTELGKLGVFLRLLITTDSSLSPPYSTTRVGDVMEAIW